MADNVSINTAGVVAAVATDDVGGFQHQRCKLSLGADGVAVDAVAGAGIVGTGVQRTTLASDDPAVVSLAAINSKAPALGQALAAASVPVVLTALTEGLTGALIEAAPATDTASSGLNGRLQRVAQRITSLIAQLPATLGIKTASASLSVAPASDATFVLGAGTAAVGKLTANTGVTIGAVEIAATQTLATVTTVGAVTAITNALPAGTNNIGDVDLASAIPAGTNLVGSVSAKLATDAIMDNATALTPKFAVIAASAAGNNTLVAAVVGKKIRVLSYTLVAAGAVTAAFQDGAAGAAKSGTMSFGANGVLSCSFAPVGHFETTANTLLNLSLGGAVSVAGHICYVEV